MGTQYNPLILLGVPIRIVSYLWIPKTFYKLPFLTNRYSDYSLLKEAIYLIENQEMNPYQIKNIFQTPIIVEIFQMLQNYDFITHLIFCICDIVIGMVISSDTFLENNSEHKFLIRFIYALNPFKIFAVMAKQTFLLYYSSIFLSIYLQYTKYYQLAPIIYAFALYQCPNALLYLIIFYFEPKKNFTSTFLISFMVLICTSWISYGNDYIYNCYLSIYKITYYKPNQSLQWALFSGQFTQYKEIYYFIVATNPLYLVIPMFLFFKKYIKSCNLQKNSIGLFVAFIYVINMMYFPFIVWWDFSMLMILQLTNLRLFLETKFFIVYVNALFLFLCVSYSQAQLWMFGANQNQLFIYCLVVLSLIAIQFTETLRLMYQQQQKASLHTESKKIILDIIQKI